MPCVTRPWDIPIPFYSVSKLPICHGAWMETGDIPMPPGHELATLHAMCDMTLG